jgi:hypothetical protein
MIGQQHWLLAWEAFRKHKCTVSSVGSLKDGFHTLLRASKQEETKEKKIIFLC